MKKQMMWLLGVMVVLLGFCGNAFAGVEEDIDSFKMLLIEQQEEYVLEMKSSLWDYTEKLDAKFEKKAGAINAVIWKKYGTKKQKLFSFLDQIEKILDSGKYKKYDALFNVLVLQQKLNLIGELEWTVAIELPEKLVSPAQSISLNKSEDIVFKVVNYSLNKTSWGYVYESSWSAVLVWENKFITNDHVIWDEDRESLYDLTTLCISQDFSSAPECKYIAQVTHHSSVQDLAYLELSESDIFSQVAPNFTSNTAVEQVDISLWDELSTYGYPSIGWETITFTQWKISGISEGKYKTDAVIDHGNSWWAAFIGTRLVGITTSIASDNNTIGYIIPYDTIAEFNNALDDYAIDSSNQVINQDALLNIKKEYEYEHKVRPNYREKWVSIEAIFDDYKKSEYDIFASDNIDYINLEQEDWYYVSVINSVFTGQALKSYDMARFKQRFKKYYFGTDEEYLETVECEDSEKFTTCSVDNSENNVVISYSLHSGWVLVVSSFGDNEQHSIEEIKQKVKIVEGKVGFYDYQHNTQNQVWAVVFDDTSSMISFLYVDETLYYPEYSVAMIDISSKQDYVGYVSLEFNKQILESWKEEDFNASEFHSQQAENIEERLVDNWSEWLQYYSWYMNQWWKYVEAVWTDGRMYSIFAKDGYSYTFLFLFTGTEELNYLKKFINDIGTKDFY